MTRADRAQLSERFIDELATGNLVRMSWLLVVSTTFSIFITTANVLYAHLWQLLPWQITDIAGSAIFLALFQLGLRGHFSRAFRWALSPGYFTFWLVLLTAYYFHTVPVYGENMSFVLGAITPAILIVMPPRIFLSLLIPYLAAFFWIMAASPEVTAGRTTEDVFGSLLNGSLAVAIAILAAWYIYSARKKSFENQALLAASAEEIRTAESNLRAILENIPFQAWLKDVDGRFLAVNQLFADANKLPRSKIVGMSAVELYGETRGQQYQEEDTVIIRAKEQINLEQRVDFDGAMFWYEVFKSPVINDRGECIGTAGLARDVTERRRMEDQLHAANRAKSEFLAAMSHEIRTPMNSVLGYAELLSTLPLDAVQRDYVDSILGSGRVLLCVINDILDFSKIEAGQLMLNPGDVDLPALLRRCLRMFEPQASTKNLELALLPLPADCPLRIHADGARLEQILINLLSNAVKFTELGAVTLRLRCDRDVLRLEVADTGIGITDDQLERLFQPFSQVDSAIARRFSGTGLGLVITQRLCDLMGGHIAVTSTPGKGSTFTATIPLVAASNITAPPPEEPEGDAVDLSSLRVLVVEDNAVNRRLVSSILKRWNIHAVLAEGGEQALEFVRESEFDRILMDVQMPGMDGFETSRKIRECEAQRPGGSRSRIIALTGLAMAGDAQRCAEAGMDDYLTKPIHTPSLRRALAMT